MIDSSTIVQTAISSFNNSALLSPSFFWSFLLMLPIFFLFFIKRNEIKSNLTKFKLTKKDPNFSFVLDVILLFYLTVMSGNYDTIRNSITFIPFIIAFVLFLIIASITNFLYKNDLINSFLKKHKKISILLVLLFLALSSYCGHPSILGFILNPASLILGFLWGKNKRYKKNETIHSSLILLLLTMMFLMQPEFFRFGQMGNLTIIHKIFLLITAFSSIMIFCILKIPAKGFLYDRAFKKLKWIFRIILSVFSFLFIVTESLPVFILVIIIFFSLIASSLFHKDHFDREISSNFLAINIALFGILSNLPILTIIGLIKISDKIKSNFKEIKSLL